MAERLHTYSIISRHCILVSCTIYIAMTVCRAGSPEIYLIHNTAMDAAQC